MNFVGHNTKYSSVPEKQFVARPKLPMWLFPFSLMHPVAYMIAKCHSGIGRNAFVQTFFSLLGRSGQSGLAQKANSAEK
jgi:hypothetical protein